MSKIRVLWVMTGGLRRNGICVSQLDYAKRIDKSKFALDVAAVHDNSDDMIKEYKKAKCKVVILPDRKENLFKYRKAFKKLIKKNKYDIVHVFGSSSLMGIELNIAKRYGAKMRIAHSRNTTCDRKQLEKILRPWFNKSYNFALACGKDAGDWLFGKKNYIILHNGKNLAKYSFDRNERNAVRKKYNIENKIAFGHVGNFNDQKNHTFLIDAFNEIHKNNDDTVLFLMGNGEKMSEIKNKVMALKLENAVIFLGSVSNVNEIIQGIDIMLFPSLFEGLPNVVIEWQAAGLPCIISNRITDECKVSELVNFASIDNASEWAKRASKINLEQQNRKSASEQACKSLTQNGFNIEINVKKLENYYIDFLNNEARK